MLLSKGLSTVASQYRALVIQTGNTQEKLEMPQLLVKMQKQVPPIVYFIKLKKKTAYVCERDR